MFNIRTLTVIRRTGAMKRKSTLDGEAAAMRKTFRRNRKNGESSAAQCKSNSLVRPTCAPAVSYHFNLMEDQKEKVRALLSVMLDACPKQEATIYALLQTAIEIHEDHESWHRLQAALCANNRE
jgi:hypothetical protein